MRSFYTALDVQRLADRGVYELPIEELDVVTDEARDLAERLGVKIARAYATAGRPAVGGQDGQAVAGVLPEAVVGVE